MGRSHPWVERTHQPVERRVVDQVIEDVVQRILHVAQLDSAGGQHAVWQLSQHCGSVEAGVHLSCRVAEGESLLLDVVGDSLQAGDQEQTGGLELLRERVRAKV